MRYTIKYLFKDCFNPNFISNKFTYFTEIDNIYYLCYNDFDFSNLQKLNNDNNQCYGFIIDSIFCTQDPMKSINIFDIEKGEKHQIKGDYFFFCKDDRFIYLSDESENTCNRLNPFTKEISPLFKVLDKDFLRYKEFVVPNFGIGYSKLNEIKLLCIKTGDLLWSYNMEGYFNSPSEIYEGRVLVVENRLVFFAHTEDWEQYATFVLDAYTGEVLFTTDQMRLKLFEYNQCIYQIQEKRIKQLCPKKLEIKTIELEKQLKARGLILEDKSACFYNHKLFATARESFSDVYNIWLIINLENREIEYQQEMLLEPKKKAKEDNKIFISDIQSNDKFVAVRCTDRLYVFEK